MSRHRVALILSAMTSNETEPSKRYPPYSAADRKDSSLTFPSNLEEEKSAVSQRTSASSTSSLHIEFVRSMRLHAICYDIDLSSFAQPKSAQCVKVVLRMLKTPFSSTSLK